MPDRLRPLWDFSDLDVSEARFRAQLEEETTDAGRAEVLTQLARVEGLRGNYERVRRAARRGRGARRGRSRACCSSAAAGSARRVSPEPGRRSSSRRSSWRARRGEDVLAVDAAHMIAIVDDMEAWTARGVEIAAASDDPGVRYWLGPLYNNVGWSRLEAGDTAGALEAFELALASRERDDPRPDALAIARYAVGKALRARRPRRRGGGDARAVRRWAGSDGVEDDYFHEELAEDYAALGRHDEAREQARRALALIPEDDDATRIARLRELAAAGRPAD